MVGNKDQFQLRRGRSLADFFEKIFNSRTVIKAIQLQDAISVYCISNRTNSQPQHDDKLTDTSESLAAFLSDWSEGSLASTPMPTRAAEDENENEYSLLLSSSPQFPSAPAPHLCQGL